MTSPIRFRTATQSFFHTPEIRSVIQRKSFDLERPRQIVAANMDLLREIDDALQADVWGFEHGKEDTERIMDLAHLKLLQGVIEEADGTPDCGLMRDLEATAIFALLDGRPTGLLSLQRWTGVGRSISLDTAFRSRIAKITDPAILSLLLTKLIGSRMPIDTLTEALKCDWQQQRGEISQYPLIDSGERHGS